jgi:hypothetical protein
LGEGSALKFLNNLLVTALSGLTLSCGVAAANDVYIAQSAAGSANGADCADAFVYTYFNTAGNWTSSTPTGTEIGPGTTAHLCGTLTSALTAQGSGTSVSPIKILFDAASAGNITMPAIPSSGAIILTGLSYITVDGNNQTGVIQSTNNGSPQGGYANQVQSQAIYAVNSSNIEVRYLQCVNLYIHTTSADNPTWGAPGPICVNFSGAAGPITIDHNVMHDCAWCNYGYVSAGNGAISMHDNTIYNFDHGLGAGDQNAASVYGPVYFYNNNLYNPSTWDTTSNEFHHDGLHLWAYCADGASYCAGTYFSNVYIYNNWFHGNPGANFNCWIFLEENNDNVWIFNNYLDSSSRTLTAGGGPLYGRGTNITEYNNTYIGTSGQTTSNQGLGGPGITNENNVVCNGPLISISSTDESGHNSTTVSAVGHNYYMSGNTAAFVWEGNFLAFSQFSTWQSESGDKTSGAAGACTLNELNGNLQAGSAAIGFGTNLYSVCNGQPNPGLGALCSDAAGTPRPATGAWDAGAYQYRATNMGPNSPTDLTVLVQ